MATIVTRSGKGSPLTNDEVDANFNNLNTEVGAALPKAGGAMTGAITTNSTFDGRDVAADGVTADAALPKSGGALSGAVTTNSTFDGRDVAADGVTADAALPKAGGTLTGNLILNDNVKGIFGTGNDLQIYHDGSNSYIRDAGTGDLNLRGDGYVRVQSQTSGTSLAHFHADAEVALYYNNSNKLVTTSTGISVTGNIANSSGDLTLDVAGDINFDADGGEFKFLDGGAETLVIGKTGNSIYLYPTASNTDFAILGNDGGVGVTALLLDMSDGGTATFNAGIRATSATINSKVSIYTDSNGAEIDNTTGNFTIDTPGNIVLDSDAGQVVLADGGTNKALLKLNGNDLVIRTEISNADIKFDGSDGGSTITALTLDMSAAGAATFGVDAKVTVQGTHSEGGGLLDLKGTDTPAAGKNLGALSFGNSNDRSLAMIRGVSTAADAADMRFFTEATGASIEERMRIDSSGQLLLGTTTSDSTLSVDIQNTSASSNNTLVRIKNTAGSEDSGLIIDGNNGGQKEYRIGVNTVADTSDLTFSGGTGYRFYTGSTERMRIDASGNLGIGTTNPVEQFAVGAAGRRIEIAGASGVIRGFNRSASWAGINFEASDYTFDCSTVRILDIEPSGVIFNDPGANTDFRIESDGNANMFFIDAGNNRVGVGLSAPLEPLHTAGRILSTTSYGSATQQVGTSIGQNAAVNATVDFRRWTGGGTNHGVGAIEVADTGIMRFYADSKTSNTPATTERISLAPSGAFTTTPTTGGHAVFNEGGIDADFRVESNNNANTLFIEGSSGVVNFGRGSSSINTNGAYILGGEIIASQPASTDTYLLRNTATTAYTFYVSSAGQIHAVQTSISSISDERLKENIVDIDTGLAEVMALKPRKFDWKEGEGSNEKNVTGFVAQEVETVLPNLIGNFKHDDLDDAKSVKMGDMVPTLVKAIQEQQTLIETLTARIAALEE